MTEERPPGIRARRIEADNVVRGVQAQGVTPEMADRLVSLAQINPGWSIDSDDIVAKNVVDGLQFINYADDATVADLRNGVSAIQSQLEVLKKAGYFGENRSDEMATVAAADALTELHVDSPDGSRVVRGLQWLAAILANAVMASEAAGKVSDSLRVLAGAAVKLWHLAQGIFGL